MTTISIIYWTLVVSAGVYLMLMLVLTSGWYRLRSFSKINTSSDTKVSVVVAVRNEEKNIGNLLQCLQAQDYPKENIEIIIVNDHSTDNTTGEIEKYIIQNKLKLQLIHAVGEGKKNALTEGFSVAKGELILTTDGDCTMLAEWIRSIVSFNKNFEPVLIFGPVVYQHERSFFQKLFSLDFMSLVASGAASSGVGLPFMGNGANIAFSAKAYQMVAKEIGSENYASGDDVFLIHKLAEKFGSKKVQFIKNTDSMVYTQPPVTVRVFLQQRIRWASKARGYKNIWAVFVSLSVFFFNLMLVVSALSGFLKNWFFAVYLLFILFRFLVDFPLLFEFSSFINKRKLLPLLILFEIIYPFYIVIAAFLGMFTKFHWKGRSQLS